MKALRSAIILLFLSGVGLTDLSAQRFDGGAYVGLVGSEIDGDSLGGLNKIGLSIGVYTALQFNEMFSMQLELNYIQKGSQDNADFEEGDYTSYKLKTDYVEIPVLFQYSPLEWLKLEAGPSMALLVNNGGLGKEYFNSNAQDPYPEMKPVTFNAIVGASFEFVRNLSLNLRFNTSLDPIRKENVSGNVKRFPTFQYGQYHNCLVISLKYRFLKFGKLR